MHTDVRVNRATEFGDLLHKTSASRIITSSTHKDMREVLLLSRLCSNGARSPEVTNIWPQATENIFLVARPGDWLVLVS